MSDVFHWAEGNSLSGTTSGSGTMGAFFANYQAAHSFSGGAVSMSPPDLVHVVDCSLHFSVTVSFGVDLNKIIPPLCTPTVCFHIPFDGDVCIPGVCITWPVITINVPTYSDSILFSTDFALGAQKDPASTDFDLVLVIVGVPTLQLSVKAAALLAAVGAAVAAAVALVPFIGPVLALAVAGIMALITLAAVTGFLGPILTPFVSGLKFTVPFSPSIRVENGLYMTVQSLRALVDAADNVVATAAFTI